MLENRGMFYGVVVMFIAIIIGVSLLSTASDTTSSLTDTYSVSNESLTGVVKDVETTTANFPIVAVSEVRNGSGSALAGDGSEWNLTDATNGGVTIYTANGTYQIDYTYRSSDYIEDDAARSLTDLIPLFFALAVLLGSMGYVAWREFM